MNFKPIELQVALPRTNEAGSVQNQLNHKPVVDQAQLLHGTEKQVLLQRKKADKTGASDHASIRDEQQNKGGGQQQRNRQSPSEQQQAEKHINHPYKGHHIDLSL